MSQKVAGGGVDPPDDLAGVEDEDRIHHRGQDAFRVVPGMPQ